MKIVIFEVEPRELAAFESLRDGHELHLVAAPLAADGFEDAEIVSTFINSTLDAATIDRFPALKLIATRSTGYDHIDLAACASKGIRVCNVPSYGANTVAEHVFALLLAISHRLPEAMVRAKSGPFSPEGLEGFDLAGKTIGVVGVGMIGRHAIRIARGFGMKVLAHDLAPDPELATLLGFRYVDLPDLLARSDIVTLHVPSTASTRHLIDAAAFAVMRRGAVLINTARGDVVDAQALVAALRAGHIGAAGLDVLPGEKSIREEAELVTTGGTTEDLRDLVADHVLLRMPNVIVTPHSAFNTREAVGRILETTVGNIGAFIVGAPRNLVG